MVSKNFLNKLKMFLIILCGLFIFVPNRVIAATNITQMEHKTNVPVNKVWQIKFNQPINVDKLSEKVAVYNPIGIKAQVKISYDSINNSITVEPPVSGYICGQTYSLQISEKIMDLNSSPMKTPVTMNFTIAVPDNGPRVDSPNNEYNYEKYDCTLDKIVDMQSKVKPVNVVSNYYLNPSNKDIYEYLNPKNFEEHDYAVYQFLALDSYTEIITAEDLNVFLKGKGVLENQGATFIKAAEENKINVAYLTAHTILETGNGTSLLSNGIEVTEVDGNIVGSKTTYNMFGIGAIDANPIKKGAERAYKEGWFNVESAIMGGAKYISTGYIHSEKNKQNTLYKMRWNPANPATHQYASDIVWSYKVSSKMKEILDKCQNANLVFEIPEYK